MHPHDTTKRQIIYCPHCGQDACGRAWPIDTLSIGSHIFPCLHCGIQFVGVRTETDFLTRLWQDGDPPRFFVHPNKDRRR